MELRQRKNKTYVFDTLEVVYMDKESYQKAINRPFKGIYVDTDIHTTLQNKKLIEKHKGDNLWI